MKPSELRAKSGDELTIRIYEVLHDSSHELGTDPGLVKDGVEADLQRLLAEQVGVIGENLTLVRREFPTAIGPVDLLLRNPEGGTVAVEVKRRGDIDGVEQLTRYLELLGRDPHLAPVTGVFAAQEIKPQAKVLAADRGIRVYTIGFGTEFGGEMNCGSQSAEREYFGGGGSFFGGGGGGGFRRGIDEDTLKQVADMTGGEYYSAESAGELQSVFENPPTSYITRHEVTEISVFFAAGAALLAVTRRERWRRMRFASSIVIGRPKRLGPGRPSPWLLAQSANSCAEGTRPSSTVQRRTTKASIILGRRPFIGRPEY